MGIVVYCPNGHRVKVKDVFAGKRVHCPICQAKTRVPRSASSFAPAPEEAMHSFPEALPTAELISPPPAGIEKLPRARPLH
jgi:hypothetical protein